MSENTLTPLESWDDFRRWLLPRMQNHYSVKEFATLVGRAPFTVREGRSPEEVLG
jgi:hypothetical protein